MNNQASRLWPAVGGVLVCCEHPPAEPCPSALSLLSLAVHPDMVTIATGQVAGTTKEGKVTEWREQDLETGMESWVGQESGPPR